MKVGTDGVLLGSWANCTHATRILDIGTGTGLIALMLAQRSNATIKAVEIDKDAANQAKLNFKQSDWSDRIEIINDTFQNYLANTDTKFNLIVSNPPYFSKSFKAPNADRNTARHNDKLPNTDLLNGVNKLLTDDGTFSVILPYTEGCILIAEAVLFNLYCIRKTNIIPSPGKPFKRILMDFKRTKSPLLEDTLVIENNTRHSYTDKYIELTKDFYLNF